MLSLKNFAQSLPNGASTSINNSPWVCATVLTYSNKDVWTLHRSRHSTCLHRWPFACYKRILDRTYYCHGIDVHPPPEGWTQGQIQQIMIWRPQIWLFGLSLLNRVLSPSVLDPKSQSRNRKSNWVMCTKLIQVPCKQHTYAPICATTIYDVQDHNRWPRNIIRSDG